MDFVSLTELALGPLMLARVRHLRAAPSGIVVSPDAPRLDMTVVVDADQHDPSIAPLLSSLTAQRPPPRVVLTARGAQPGGATALSVTVEPHVMFASPEALDRIAAAIEEPGLIAVYPWQKTSKRYEALSTFFVLASVMTTGAFAALPLRPRRIPTAVRAWKTATGGRARVLGGGHIVAERRYPNGVRELVEGWTLRIADARAAHPLALLCTIAFFYGAAATASRLMVDPSWAHFAWYSAYVFAISLCLRQVGKFARLATAIYPVTLGFFFVVAVRASVVSRVRPRRSRTRPQTD